MILDRVYVPRVGSLHVFESIDGVFHWSRMGRSGPQDYLFDVESEKLADIIPTDESSHLECYEPMGDIRDPWSVWKVEWCWKWGGFNFGAGTNNFPAPARLELWAIPYWSLVLPLTLVSAYLLLQKPAIEK